MEQKISPLPWGIVEWPSCDKDGAIECSGSQVVDAAGYLVSASITEGASDEEEATLAFIVKAANTHDALLASLKDALHCFLLDHAHDHPTANNWRATIAAAEGK